MHLSFLRNRQSDADRIRAEIRRDNMRNLTENAPWHRAAGLSDHLRNRAMSHRIRPEFGA